MKILIKVQYGRDDYDEELVDEFDSETIERIKRNNKKVNHRIYEEKKRMSKFSVEQVQMKIGHEFPDIESDPFYESNEEWYEKKDEVFVRCLGLLDEASKGLTKKQSQIVEEVKKYKGDPNFCKIGKKFGITCVAVKKSYMAAIKKMKKYLRQYSELKEYFPNLFKD